LNKFIKIVYIPIYYKIVFNPNFMSKMLKMIWCKMINIMIYHNQSSYD